MSKKPAIGSTVGVAETCWFRLGQRKWKQCQIDPSMPAVYSTWKELKASGDITVIYDPSKPKRKGRSEVADLEVTAVGKGGTPPTSPWLAYSAQDFAGKVISFTVTFDASNNLTGATTFRDPACVYTKVYIGLGPDGTPNTTPTQFTVPAGTTNVTKAQINAIGVFTVADAQGTQITAGP